MLAVLTDAQISPNVAEQVKAKQPKIVIHSLQSWRGGSLLEADDDAILAAAFEENLTLMTCDQRTIAPLILQWSAAGRDHAGIIFIDEKSIAQADIGGKVRAILSLCNESDSADWTNTVAYLKADS